MPLIFFQGLKKGQELKNTALFKAKVPNSKKPQGLYEHGFETTNTERAPIMLNQYPDAKMCHLFYSVHNNARAGKHIGIKQ